MLGYKAEGRSGAMLLRQSLTLHWLDNQAGSLSGLTCQGLRVVSQSKTQWVSFVTHLRLSVFRSLFRRPSCRFHSPRNSCGLMHLKPLSLKVEVRTTVCISLKADLQTDHLSDS